MPRENDVRLLGCVADMPRIVKDDLTGKYIRGIFHLTTIKSPRDTGAISNEEDHIKYDWPLIWSSDETIVAEMAKLKQYDIVVIRGSYTTKGIVKKTYCKACGELNAVEGRICFVNPMFLKKRNDKELTEKQSIQYLKENSPVSNSIVIVGNLCNEVNYFHEKNIQTSVYQIATDRKFFVKGEPPEVRTDFPTIRSYGKNAKLDSLCAHTGTSVLIDGYLHSREFPRKTTCQACGEEYEWTDNTIDIVPFVTEYLSNYTDPETALEQQKQQKADAGEEAIKNLLGK